MSHGIVLASLSGPRESAAATRGLLTSAAEVARLGMWVFFVLCGYLLGRLFLRAFLEQRRPPSIRGYLRNRTLRILPLLWLTFTLTIVVFGMLGASAKQLVALYLFGQELAPSSLSDHVAHTWSVDVENNVLPAAPRGRACRHVVRQSPLLG